MSSAADELGAELFPGLRTVEAPAPPLALPLLEAPPVAWPSWYRPTKARPAANRAVARGLHPFGRALGPEGATCGACAHAFQRWGRPWKKCAKSLVGCTARTDLNTRWRACELPAPREEDPP